MPHSPLHENRLALYVLISLAVALAIRLWVTLPSRPLLYDDEMSLWQYASNVAQGQYYGTQGAYWPPGFLFLAGWLFRVFGADPTFLAVRILDAFLAAGTAGLLALWAGRTLSQEAGLLAGLLFAIHRNLIYYSGRFYSETLFLFLLLAAFLAYDDHARSGRTRPLVLGSVLLGLSALTRPVSLPLLGILPVWWAALQWPGGRWPAWRRLLRNLLVAGAVTAMTIAPWTLRNWVVMHQLVPIDTNGGLNFYLAHNPRANGAWVDLSGDPIIAMQDRPEVSSAGFKAGLAYALSHPERELELLLAKNRMFWTDRDGGVDAHAPANLTLLRRWRVPGVSIWTLSVLALLGLPFLLRRWRRTLPALLFALYYYVLIMLVYFAPRYRLVIEPLLILSAAAFGGALLQLFLRLGRSIRNRIQAAGFAEAWPGRLQANRPRATTAARPPAAPPEPGERGCGPPPPPPR